MITYLPLFEQVFFFSRLEGEDTMDVDEEDENEGNEEEEEEVGGDTEGDEPAQMSVDDEDGEEEKDEEGNSQKKTRKNKTQKLQPRKSHLNITALQSSQAVLAQYSSQEITQRRLQKKFCRDALTFIDEVERAMEPMVKLLGSTNKAEVLEVMDFFKVASEYGFDSAKVSFTFFPSF